MKGNEKENETRRCGQCGREFLPAPMHIYKRGCVWFCKYSCMTAYDREKQIKRRKEG